METNTFKTLFVVFLSLSLAVTWLFSLAWSYPINPYASWTYEGDWKVADGFHFEKNTTGVARAIMLQSSVALGKLDYMLYVNFPTFSGSKVWVVETFGTALVVEIYMYESFGFIGVNVRYNGQNMIVLPSSFTTLTGVNLELSIFNNSGDIVVRTTVYWGPTKTEQEVEYSDWGTVSYNRTIRMEGVGKAVFSDYVFDYSGGDVGYFDSKPDWIGQIVATVTGIYNAIVFIYKWVYNATVFLANTLYFFYNFTVNVIIPVAVYIIQNVWVLGAAFFVLFITWRYVIPFSSIAMFRSKEEFYDRVSDMFDKLKNDIETVINILVGLIPL